MMCEDLKCSETCKAPRICKFGTEGKNFLFKCGPYKCSEIAEAKCKSNNSTKSSNSTKSTDIKTKNVPSKRIKNI